MRGLSSSKEAAFYLDACKGVHWSSILTTHLQAVMATKTGQGVTKMIRRCKFLTFRGLLGSDFFILRAQSCFSFCLCRIEEGRDRSTQMQQKREGTSWT